MTPVRSEATHAGTSARPRPSLWQSLAECRALVEFMSIGAARPMLRRSPTGDGHPVLVFPGFFAADQSTATLRRYLISRGYSAHAWDEGRNPGISDELYRRLENRLLTLAETENSTVSLVGWSLGGIYARLLAHRQPDAVRQVVTLGSPFRMNEWGSVNGSVARLYQRMNPGRVDDPMLAHSAVWAEAPPVPSTSTGPLRSVPLAHWATSAR